MRQQLARRGLHTLAGPGGGLGGAISLTCLSVCIYAFVHSVLYHYSITALRFRELQSLWAARSVFGFSVLQASAGVAVGLGVLLVLEAWREVSLKSDGHPLRLIGIMLALILVGSLAAYFWSVTSALHRLAGRL